MLISWPAIAAGALIAVAIVFVVIRLLHRSTLYWSHSSGFTAFSLCAEEDLEAVSPDRFARILERFMQADLFDSLSISHDEDEENAFLLGHDEGEIEMTVSFTRSDGGRRMGAFREAISSAGYSPASEDAFNEGFGELESVMLEYRIDPTLDIVRVLVEHALVALGGSPGNDVFVNAWRSQDGPAEWGLRVVPRRNLLEQVP